MDMDAQKDFTYRMTQDEYFRYKKNWWISLNKSKNRTGEKSFWLQRCVDYSKPSSPRIWRRTTMANSILETPAMTPYHRVLLQPLLGGNGMIPGGAHDSPSLGRTFHVPQYPPSLGRTFHVSKTTVSGQAGGVSLELASSSIGNERNCHQARHHRPPKESQTPIHKGPRSLQP